MKAGTAAKMALGLLSSAAFVRLGAVRERRMVALRPASEKLRRRAVRNVAELAGVSAATARRLLAESRVGRAPRDRAAGAAAERPRRGRGGPAARRRRGRGGREGRPGEGARAPGARRGAGRARRGARQASGSTSSSTRRTRRRSSARCPPTSSTSPSARSGSATRRRSCSSPPRSSSRSSSTSTPGRATASTRAGRSPGSAPRAPAPTSSRRRPAAGRGSSPDLDREVLYLVLRATLRLHDLEEDPDPEFDSDRFMRTPGGEVRRRVPRGRRRVRRGPRPRSTISTPRTRSWRRASSPSIRSDLPSELEESALRWRTGRLADLGYPTVDEALSWFARPPRRAGARRGRAGAAARLPPRGARARLAARPRRRARSRPRTATRSRRQIVAAANAVLVADAVDPGDVDAVRAAFEAARGLPRPRPRAALRRRRRARPRRCSRRPR